MFILTQRFAVIAERRLQENHEKSAGALGRDRNLEAVFCTAQKPLSGKGEPVHGKLCCVVGQVSKLASISIKKRTLACVLSKERFLSLDRYDARDGRLQRNRLD